MLVTHEEPTDAFRSALRKLTRSVVIITSSFEGKRYAMAATAVCELSMSPPSMLVCVNRGSSIHPPLEAGAPFAINVLAKYHLDIAHACSGALKGEDRFSVGTWTYGKENVPILADACASIICTKTGQLDHGTHSVILGNVIDVISSSDGSSLVYSDGAYGKFFPAED